MAKYELKLPKMGESVEEATLTTWLVDIGDTIDLDDGIVEVSTDKVDTEIPSEVRGVLVEKRFEVDAVVKIGETIAIIEVEGETLEEIPLIPEKKESKTISIPFEPIHEDIEVNQLKPKIISRNESDRFYSPLVRNIAHEENIGIDELNAISGTGKNNRLTKDDILTYLDKRIVRQDLQEEISTMQKEVVKAESITTASGDVVVPMDRMGKIIAKHMIHSKQTSAHVQSFIEIDVTRIVNWRNKVKNQFLTQKGEKLTYTPIFIQAVAQTITEFPMVNISVENDSILKRKSINIGMATALPDGNLIVPVIKNADELNLMGMVKAVNSLAEKARNKKLSPDDIQGGTYTVTNVGSFGSITGTPIINQPQVAILAIGAIRKLPAVIETAQGDFIGIRHKMIVAHSYDHRVVNGALGGQFILRLKQILENFDENKSV